MAIRVNLQDILSATKGITGQGVSLADAGYNAFQDQNFPVDKQDPRVIAIKGHAADQEQIIEYDPVDPLLLKSSYEVQNRINDLKALKQDKELALTSEEANNIGIQQLENELNSYMRLGTNLQTPAYRQRAVQLQQAIDERYKRVTATVTRKLASGTNQVDHEIARLETRKEELVANEKLNAARDLSSSRNVKDRIVTKQAEEVAKLTGEQDIEEVKDKIIGKTVNPAAVAIVGFEQAYNRKMPDADIIRKFDKEGATLVENRLKANNPGPITPENKRVIEWTTRVGDSLSRVTPETIESLDKETTGTRKKGDPNSLREQLLNASGVKDKEEIRNRAVNQLRTELYNSERQAFATEVLTEEMKSSNFLLDKVPLANDAEKEGARWLLTNFPNILDYDPSTKKMADRWNAVEEAIKWSKGDRSALATKPRAVAFNAATTAEKLVGDFPSDVDLYTLRRKMITNFIDNLRKRYSFMEGGVIPAENSHLHILAAGGIQ